MQTPSNTGQYAPLFDNQLIHHPFTRTLHHIGIILGIFLISAAFLASPVSAGTKYQSGSPNISCTISGTNDFLAGSTVPLNLTIENSGLNEMKIVQSGVVDRDDLPSTAKMVKVTVAAGDAPVNVKSDPQMIGDVASSQSVPVAISLLVKDDAKAGTYSLPVTLTYTYLAEAEQQGTDSISYRYNTKDITMNIPFSVKSSMNVEVTSVVPESVNAGGSGYITLTLLNSGTETGQKAVAKLIRKGNSPITPVDSSIYLGTLQPGGEAVAKFKVSVSQDAEPQTYPLGIQVDYENADGESLSSKVEDFGVDVGAKVQFSIVQNPQPVSPGQKPVIEVRFRNDGSSPAYSAEVRISAVDPFTSNDDLAYLGDVKPGESAVAKFGVNVANDATPKAYGLDSEVRYRDALGNSQISDTVKVPIQVQSTSGMGPLPGLLVLALILAGGYYLYSKRRSGSAV